jgi:hypothetical protein
VTSYSFLRARISRPALWSSRRAGAPAARRRHTAACTRRSARRMSAVSHRQPRPCAYHRVRLWSRAPSRALSANGRAGSSTCRGIGRARACLPCGQQIPAERSRHTARLSMTLVTQDDAVRLRGTLQISARSAAGVRHDSPVRALWHMRWQFAQRRARSSRLVSRSPDTWRGSTWCTSM